MRVAARIFALLFLCASIGHASSLPDVRVDATKVRTVSLKLCSTPGSQGLAYWHANVDGALRRIRLAAYGRDQAFTIARGDKAECAVLEGYTCLGSPEGITVCDESALTRIAYVAAVLAGANVLSAVKYVNASSYPTDVWLWALRAMDTSALDPIEAFGLVDAIQEESLQYGVRAPGEPGKLESRLRRLEEAYGPAGRVVAQAALTAADGIRELDVQPSPLDTTQEVKGLALILNVMLHVYRSGFDQALSFLVGHELAHAHGGCAALGGSAVAVERRVAQLLALQVEEEHFCANPPSTSEINADRCGLTAMKATNDDWQRRERVAALSWQVSPGFQSLGSRLSIDLLGQILVGGLGSKVHEHYLPEIKSGRIDYWPKLVEGGGYLHSALRLLLVAEVFQQNRPPDAYSNGIAVCGGTASRLMEGLQRARIGCSPKNMPVLHETAAMLETMGLPVAPRAWGILHGAKYDFQCYR